MKYKRGVLSGCAVALLLCMALMAGCGIIPHAQAENQESVDVGYVVASENEALQNTIANREELKLAESGYILEDGGYIRYFGIIENPNDALAARGVRFNVVGYGPSDLILLSDSVYLDSPLGPHQRMAFVGSSSLSQGDLERLEYQPGTDEDKYSKIQWLDKSAISDMLTADSFKAEATGEERSGYGLWKMTGTLTNDSDTIADSVDVYVALRDGAGALVGVYNDYLSNVPAHGSITFEITGFDVPEYASYELFVDPSSWS